MSKLFLRGVSKPITISTAQAVNLGAWYDDPNVNAKAKSSIGGVRFLKEDIKYIIENDSEDNAAEVSDSRKSENDSYYTEVTRNYSAEISRLCERPLEDKINDIRVYELVWTGFTLEPMTREFVVEVQNRQRKFYEQNPKHPYASINIQDLLPKDKTLENHVREVMPSYISNKVMRIIGEAYSTARLLRKI